MSGNASWDANLTSLGLPGDLAEEVFQASLMVQELFNLDDSKQLSLCLTQREGDAVEGVLSEDTDSVPEGVEPVTAVLDERASNKLWGEFTSWEIVEASAPEIRGKRVASCFGPAEDGESLEEREVLLVQDADAGDTLVLIDPDKAAVGDLLLFDLLPDQCEALVPLLDPDAAEGVDKVLAEEVLKEQPEIRQAMQDPEIREATRFAHRLAMLTTEEARCRLRMQRLSESQVARKALVLAQEDEELRRAVALFEPVSGRLYEAGRKVQDEKMARFQKVPQVPEVVMSVALNGFQILGGLLVTATLGFIAAQIAKSAIKDVNENDLPMYSLQTDPAAPTPAKVTPLMPMALSTTPWPKI